MTLEQAWAAGLFDGEGSVTVCGGRQRLQLKMVDQASVERFADAVGTGHVYGPYANRSGERDGYPRKPFFLWVAEQEAALDAASLLYPLLSAVRRGTIDRVLGDAVSKHVKTLKPLHPPADPFVGG